MNRHAQARKREAIRADHARAEAIVARAKAAATAGPLCVHYYREHADHQGVGCRDCRFLAALMAGEAATLVEMRSG